MARIDERIVSMAFDSAKFEGAISKTIGLLGKFDGILKNIGVSNGLIDVAKFAAGFTLGGPLNAVGKFKSALNSLTGGRVFSDIEKSGDRLTLGGAGRAIDKTQSKLSGLGAGSTFTDIERAADRTTLNGLTSALDNVTNKFSVLHGAASVALGGIAATATMKGASFAKSFAFGPLTQGLEEYQTNLGSIQTILANTEGQNVSGLQAVQDHLGELNTYSDQTIYNFSEMAKNIGTFTAAGVDLDKSTQSIKGIANLAALSGSNSQQASTAMYQLSQAIAAGKVGLQDWNSVVNAGMGGAVFQKSLMRTAENMGALKDGAVEIDKATGKATVNGQSFRESIMAKPGQESWLTSEVLTNTLQQFTGDMKEADLIAQGFSEDQAKAIVQQAKTAKSAATEVKTLSQAFDVARESIGSGWSRTFQLIFGDFEQSKKTFTEFSNFLNGIITRASNARNRLLEQFNVMGGREKAIEALKTAFSALLAAIRPVYKAFRSIFPPTTATDLLSFVKGFQDLAEAVRGFFLEHGGQLQNTFAGIFAVLHIGWTIVKRLIGVVGDLFGSLADGSGGILNFTAGIGIFLQGLDDAISKGDALGAFFDTFTGILKTPLTLLKDLAGLIAGLFSGDTTGKSEAFNAALENVGAKLGPLEPIVRVVADAFKKMLDVVQDLGTFLQPIFSAAIEEATEFISKLSDAFTDIDFETVFSGLQAGLLGGIFLTLKKALGGDSLDFSFFGGIKEQLTEAIEALTGALKSMQQALQAGTLLAIAAAVLVLAGGMFILSKLNGEQMARSLTAIAVGLGELVAVMRLLSGLGAGGAAAMVPIAAAMVLMAGAVVILAGAVHLFARLSWEDMIKGLAGVAGSLTAVGVAMRLIGPRILYVGPALIPLAAGMTLLAVALKIMASLSWEEMVRGLIGMGGAMAILALTMGSIGPAAALAGPSMIALSAGMVLLALALSTFGAIAPEQIAIGLLAMSGALIILASTVTAFPPTLALQAAGLVILGVAMTGLAAALAIFGKLRVGTIIKGLIAMGGALAVLAVGLTLMAGTIPGAVALMGAAVALAILAPTLAVLGNLEWGTIFKGLATIALTLGTIAIVGLVAAPALLAIGFALATIGLGVISVATGIYILSKGISLLASDGQKGIAVMLTAITGLIALLPTMAINFVKGLVDIAKGIAEVAPKLVDALVKILTSVIEGVITLAPKLAVAIGSLIDVILVTLNEKAGPLIQAGFRLLLNLLKGIDDNIGQIVTRVGHIVTTFLGKLAEQAPKIVASGASLVVSYLKGIANNLGRVVAQAAQIIIKFLDGVAQNLPKIYSAGFKVITNFLNALADGIPRVIKAGVNVITSTLEGIARAIPRIAKAGADVVISFVRAIGKQAPRIADAAFKALIDFMHGLADAIRNNTPKLMDAGWDIADAIVDGLVNGLKKLGHKAVDAIGDLVKGLPKKAISLLGIASPSKVFIGIGMNISDGLGQGIEAHGARAYRAMTNVLRQLINTPQEIRQMGKFLGGEFMDGLDGALTEGPTGRAGVIEGAFAGLRGKFKEQQGKIREDIKSDRQKLAQELDKDNPSEKVVVRLQKDINANVKLLGRAKAATNSLMKGLQDEKAQLLGLAASYDKVTSDLEAAQTELDRLIDLRSQMRDSLKDQYSELPDFDTGLQEAMDEAEMSYAERAAKRREREKEAQRRAQIDQVALYKKALEQQIEDTKKFRATLEKLRELGLDDVTYEKLAKQGISAQSFADQLLRGGAGGIAALSQLDKDLAAEAVGLADTVSTEFHKAGIEAATTFVNELKKKQGELEAQMILLGGAIVSGIKKALGIKSPSRVLAEVGQNTAEGLIVGLQQSTGAVASAATDVGDTAALALSDSLSNISETVSAEIDSDLTLTPVLDLSEVKKGAQFIRSDLQDVGNVIPLSAAASYGQASAISAEQAAALQTQAELAAAATAPTTVEFNQYNTSPESLSDAEIYRQTNNQLSQAKRVLGLAS